MSQDDRFAEVLKLLDNAWPYKRVKAPQHVLDQLSKVRGQEILELAVTVPKDIDEEAMWAEYDYEAVSKSWDESTPITFDDSNN